MKIGGVSVTAPVEELLVLPRGENLLVFKAKPLTGWAEFDKLVPEPTPPGKLTKDGWVPDPEDKDYKSIVAQYHEKRIAYLVVYSLEPSGIEWELVNPANPRTWTNWKEDFTKAGITQVELNHIWNLVLEANTLSEGKLKLARESFQRGQAQAKVASSGEPSELPNTSSGTPATE